MTHLRTTRAVRNVLTSPVTSLLFCTRLQSVEALSDNGAVVRITTTAGIVICDALCGVSCDVCVCESFATIRATQSQTGLVL